MKRLGGEDDLGMMFLKSEVWYSYGVHQVFLGCRRGDKMAGKEGFKVRVRSTHSNQGMQPWGLAGSRVWGTRLPRLGKSKGGHAKIVSPANHVLKSREDRLIFYTIASL